MEGEPGRGHLQEKLLWLVQATKNEVMRVEFVLLSPLFSWPVHTYKLYSKNTIIALSLLLYNTTYSM